MNHVSIKPARTLWLGLCLLACGLLAGCASVEKTGDKAADTRQDAWGANLRVPTTKGQMSGLDERARAIERDLGVQ